VSAWAAHCSLNDRVYDVINELLEASGQRLLAPLVTVSGGAVLVRGIFSFARSRSQDRRDFLELFRNWESQSELWLSVAVRHVFGAYLPSALIRQLMASPHPGRALLEVSAAWDFLDMDDETGEVYWRRRWLGSGRIRRLIFWCFPALYFVFAGIGFWLAYLGVRSPPEGGVGFGIWVYALACLGTAIFFLSYSDSLKEAHRAASPWLGLGG
jgi:hypothetical protein